MSIQKVITNNGGETLTARMMDENMVLIQDDWRVRKRVIRMNPREAHELARFILANVPEVK